MTPQDFCYWLQGVFEVADPAVLDHKQVEIVKKHLALVFANVTGSDKAMGEYLKTFTAGSTFPTVQLC